MNTRKRLTAGTIAGALILLVVVLAAAAAFYGFMVYQSASEDGESMAVKSAGLDPAGLFPRTSPVPGEPVPRVVLRNTSYVGQHRGEGKILDQDCTQIVDSYVLEDGRTVRVITAWPPAWIETLAGSGWVPQLITGFNIGELPAVYYVNGTQSMLIAREDPYIYVIQVEGEDVDGQTVYALGVLASIEKEADSTDGSGN